MSSFTVTLAIISIVFITILFIRRLFENREKKYPKGPIGFPVVGHLPLIGNFPTKTFMKWWETYGDVFSIRLGSWDAVVCNGYNAVKEAAEHPDDAFSGRPNFVTMEILREHNNEDPFAFGTFSPVYLKQRKLASKALRLFTFKRSEIIEDLVTSEANAFADILIKQYSTRSGTITQDVEIFIGRVIYQFLYGRGKTSDVERDVKILIAIVAEFNQFTKSGNALDVLPWLQYIMPGKIDKLRDIVSRSDAIMKEQVRKHYETFVTDNIRDVADAILLSDIDDEENKDRYVLTRSRLNQTLDDFQGAGVDTTTKALSWLFLYMAEFPQVQERVYMEVTDIVGTDRNVMLKDKPQLVYTNAVILEVLRIVTQVPFSLPHYAMKNAKLQGFDVNKDTVVLFNLYSVHHEKEFWGDPENFRPERFVPDGKSLDQEKCNHIFAFGHGRRRCVGEILAKMELFLSFSIVIQKCKIMKPTGENLELTPIPGLVYSCKPFKVLVQKRN